MLVDPRYQFVSLSKAESSHYNFKEQTIANSFFSIAESEVRLCLEDKTLYLIITPFSQTPCFRLFLCRPLCLSVASK